jgi:cation-transporting ATPase E
LLPLPTTSRDRQARQKADDIAAEGFRVLLLAQSSAECDGDDKGELPADLQPIALVVLAERLRSGVAETLDFFRQQGVALKVISGDNPRTVSAIATRAGLLDNLNDAAAIDARDLPEDLDELAAIVEEHSAFGRVSPHQKRAMVAALQRRGHVVAMTGDGVNDALALKDADIGVAMGSGSAATRAVAQIVLLDGNFQHLPEVVAEGRRVAANIERAATLFVLKNVYALVLALMSVAAVVAYPLAPIQLTLIATATIGIPGFVLALAPNQRRYVPGYLGRVLRFAVPAGILVGASAYLAYWLDRLFETQASVAHGRSAATIVVLTVSLWVVFVLARPLRRRDWSLLIVIVTLVTIILAVPMFGHAFLFTATPAVFGIGLVIGACGIFAVETLARSTWRFVRPD